MVPLPGHWVDGGCLGRLIWPFRGVAAFSGLAHARLGVRSRVRLGRALRSGQLNRPRVQKVLAAEAGVPFPSVRIEDSERRPAAGWAGPVAGDDHLRSLADDVTPEANPRSASQLETDSRRLADGSGDGLDEPWGLQDHEADPGSSGERREPAQAVGDSCGCLDAGREIDDEEVHGPAREQ
jgi:hypothetical protein